MCVGILLVALVHAGMTLVGYTQAPDPILFCCWECCLGSMCLDPN